MIKKFIILALSATVVLSGCQKSQEADTAKRTEARTAAGDTAQSEVVETDSVVAESTVAETSAGTDKLSKMDELEFGALPEELLKAFQEDYVRAAELAGITADHNDLVIDESEEGMLMIPLTEGLQLILQTSPTVKMVWYAGYPDDNELFSQEMLLALMAGDNTLSAEEAKTLIGEIVEEGWNNRNNLPSAVNKNLPSGVLYSYGINDRGLTSFQVAYLVK